MTHSGHAEPGSVAFVAYRRALDRSHLRHAHHFLVWSVLATSFYYLAFAAGTAQLPSGIAGALSGAIPLFSFVAAALLSFVYARRFLSGLPIAPAALTTYQVGLALLTLAVVTAPE